MPEDFDGDAASGIPKSRYAEIFGGGDIDHAFGDGDGAVLVIGAVIAEAGEVELPGFAFD